VPRGACPETLSTAVSRQNPGPAPGFLFLGLQLVVMQAGDAAQVDHGTKVAPGQGQAVQPVSAVFTRAADHPGVYTDEA
jgi:hypothetical protein